MQPWLLIGYGAPQCPPPASPSPAGAATLVVVANAARSSGHSCASQRPASPTRSQTPQLRAPDPSPPTHPPAQSPAAQSPWLLHPLAARMSPPPAPSPTRLMPPWPSPLSGGPGPCTWPFPISGGLFRKGEAAGGAGRGGASPSSFSERAQSWSQKSRRRDIQTEPRRVWQERGREGAGGGEKRGSKERAGGEKEGTSVSKSMLSEPWRDSPGCGTQGRPSSGGDGLRPTETAQHPNWPGQDRHRQKPRSMHTGQTEGGLWAAQTHTRTSPHNGLLSMTGQGHGPGPQRGHHGCPTSWEAMERPACSQPLA